MLFTKVISFFFIMFLSACLLAAWSVKPAQDSQEIPYIITNVNIVDVISGTILKDQQVVIDAGKIIAIEQAFTKPPFTSLPVRDAQGGYLIPGLIDMHVHAYEKSAFQLTLSHGVTHVRIMNGIPEQLEWRTEQQQGRWLASSLTVSSPIVHSGNDLPMSWRADTADEAREIVHKAKVAGFDLIKAYGSMNDASLSALLDEAEKLQIAVAKHGPHPPEGMSWEKLKSLQSMEHVEDVFQGILHHEHSYEKLPEAINQIEILDVPVTPTLNTFWQLTKISEDKQAFLDAQPEDYISSVVAYEDRTNQVKRWLDSSDDMATHNRKTLNFLLEVANKLADADITLLVGSDSGVLLSPHGLATINEMKLLKQAGIENIKVLQAATINAAKALGKDKNIGYIQTGLNADLILLDKNPLTDLSGLDNPVAVIKNGTWLDQEALKELREHALEHKSLFAEISVLIKNY